MRFANTGAAAAQASFQRGVALLHSYEYADARDACRDAERADPRFALAYWCEALTQSQFDWGTEDLPAARAALGRLAPTREQRLALAGSDRERAFGAAVESFLSDGTLIGRARGFAAAMIAASDAAPNDLEALAFAARASLYVLRYAPPAERVDAAQRAIGLAERVVAANPDHPGGVHYLIHATDSPRFAERGLKAARLYDRLAPDADHALHMPSHIFLQLGLWDDVVPSNERAWAASRAWVARGKHGPAELGWHSLQWLQYGYLQQGRWRAAYAVIDSARGLLDTASATTLAGYPDVRYTVETLAYQYGNETGQWDRVLPLLARSGEMVRAAPPASSLREQQMAAAALHHAALGSILARRDTTAALANIRALGALTGTLPGDSPLRGAAANMTDQATALLAVFAGHRDSVVATLERAAATARSDASVAPIGPPTTLPASEMLGALLLEAGRGVDAAAAYARALVERPNRATALLGLARAKLSAGDTSGAAAAYSKLLQIWAHADSDLPMLAEVKRGAR